MKPTLTICSALALTLSLAACGSGGDAQTSTPGSTASASSTSPSASITVTDAWAKAQPNGMMTGVFGIITNTTDKPVTISGGSSDASAVVELHETVTKDGQSAMQKVDGGFVVEAGKTRELRPGGDHIMLMQLKSPLKPGDTARVTLTTDAGDVTFEAVAKTYTGGDEKYHSGSPTSPGSMSSMSSTPPAPSHMPATPSDTTK